MKKQLKGSLLLLFATIIRAVLLASVPLPVKIISDSSAEIERAAAVLASFTIISASIPKVCKEDGFPQAFSKALSKEKRNEWRELYCQELDEQKQLDRLFSILNVAIKEFNKYQENRNYTLTKEEQEFMEDEILNTSGTNNTKGNYC